MSTFNERLLDSLVRHQTGLLSVSGWLFNNLDTLLGESDDTIKAALLDKLAERKDLSIIRKWALVDEVMMEVARARGKSWDKVEKELYAFLPELVEEEQTFLLTYLFALLPVMYVAKKMTNSEKAAIVSKSKIEGRTVAQMLQVLRNADLNRLSAAVQFGVTQGHNARRIMFSIFGTKQANYADGVLKATRTQLASVARTLVTGLASYTRGVLADRNSDIIKKERFTAVLDARTTALCRSLDGEVYVVGEGPIPPLHMNCRSLRVPIMDGDTMLQFRIAEDTRDGIYEDYANKHKINGTERSLTPTQQKDFTSYLNRRIRAIIGTPDGNITYDVWLRRQSAEYQDEVLGVAKGKLFRAGMSLDRFVARDGSELSLKELAEKEQFFFRRAGLTP